MSLKTLRKLVNDGCTPFICTLFSGDGLICRVLCRNELDVEGFLINIDLPRHWNWSNNLNAIISALGDMKRYNIAFTKFFDEEGSEFYLLVEQIVPVMHIIIFGAGHVGKAVAETSLLMGWNVTVVDDRTEFLDLINGGRGIIKKINQPFEVALSQIKFNRNSALVIVTRGHQFDEMCLNASLESQAFYLGMIGSKRRILSIKKKLESKGIMADKLTKLHAPIGININARTPQEIAISIIAEIISIKNSDRILES